MFDLVLEADNFKNLSIKVEGTIIVRRADPPLKSDPEWEVVGGTLSALEGLKNIEK